VFYTHWCTSALTLSYDWVSATSDITFPSCYWCSLSLHCVGLYSEGRFIQPPWEQKGSSSSSSTTTTTCGAGGNPAYHISTFEVVCTLTPILVPHSSPEVLHARRCERPLLAKGGEMAGQI
jgi:hypothetical protein